MNIVSGIVLTILRCTQHTSNFFSYIAKKQAFVHLQNHKNSDFLKFYKRPKAT